MQTQLPISIHAPTWGATDNLAELKNYDFQFQSTHPRGVRPGDSPGVVLLRHNFNPRTHVGCDYGRDVIRQVAKISIHAPTWGATIDSDQPPAAHIISIHAPTWGATHGGGHIAHRLRISIHAPTWGATSPPRTPQPAYHNFNPRTHVGCDLLRQILSCVFDNFNPRTHVGCDLLIVAISPLWSEFQSTHPRGVRQTWR